MLNVLGLDASRLLSAFVAAARGARGMDLVLRMHMSQQSGVVVLQQQQD
jgi:hypothetical protein